MSQLLTSNNQQSSYAATWNDAATVFTAWKLSVTDSGSNSNSLLMDVQVVGGGRITVNKFGDLSVRSVQFQGWWSASQSGTGGISFGSGHGIAWGSASTNTPAGSISGDTRLYRDGAGILAQRESTNTQAFRLYRTWSDSSNYEALELAHATYSSAQYSILRTITAGTGADNINLVLSPSGTGAIVAQMPDGTIAGGNARGTYALDLQTDPRVNANEVASGNASVALGSRNRATGDRSVSLGYANLASGNRSFAAGEGNTASGGLAVAMGRYCTASATESACIGGYNQATGTGSFAWGSSTYAASAYSTAGGLYSKSDKQGQASYASGRFAADGDAQRSVLVMRCLTTDDSKTQLYLDGASLQATIPNNTAWHADIRIVGRENAGANHAVFHRKVGIYKNTTAASATLLGTVQTIGTDYKSDAAWAVTITADTGTGALKIEVQGNLDQDVRWVAEVSLVEVAFA